MKTLISIFICFLLIPAFFCSKKIYGQNNSHITKTFPKEALGIWKTVQIFDSEKFLDCQSKNSTLSIYQNKIIYLKKVLIVKEIYYLISSDNTISFVAEFKNTYQIFVFEIAKEDKNLMIISIYEHRSGEPNKVIMGQRI